MFCTIDERNVRLRNALDVDLKITSSQNFQSHQKRMKKRRNQVPFNEKGNLACDNGNNNSDQKIYAYMERMSINEECPSENYGDSSQLTNWILYSGATWHMTPEVSDFIPGSLEGTDK